jgi:hypothetical protein
MIEKSVIEYLLAIPDIKTMFKGQIYYRASPPTAKLPWCVVSNAGGGRNKITQTGLSEAFDTLLIYVDTADQFVGRSMAERLMQALENYRGKMGTERDLIVTCESIRDLNGWQGNFRYILPVHIKYIFDSNVPH